MAAPLTVPALPTADLDGTIQFWEGLGFTAAYRQRTPNGYAVMRHPEGVELHFFSLAVAPEANFSTCLVVVSEVAERHRAVSAALRERLGRVPGRGFPRLSRFRDGQTRFTITDPAGNSVIYVKDGREDEAAAQAWTEAGLTPLQRALALAVRLRDFKNDDTQAARVLDVALGKADPADPDLTDALTARIELAEVLGELDLATSLRARMRAQS